MDNLMTLALEAHSDEHNHHRRYEIVIGRDLFDKWTVVVRFGRVGQSGQEQRYSSNDADEIQAIVRDRLRRRLSAPNRIGCAYQMVAFNTTPDLKTEPWVPNDLMARLLLLSKPKLSLHHARAE